MLNCKDRYFWLILYVCCYTPLPKLGTQANPSLTGSRSHPVKTPCHIAIMSLAQRRTTLEGIDTVPSRIPEDALSDGTDGTVNFTTINHLQRRESAVTNPSTIPIEDGKEVWQALSYDPFTEAGPPQLQHYESFPPELAENVAAYEVSTARRIGMELPPLTSPFS